MKFLNLRLHNPLRLKIFQKRNINTKKVGKWLLRGLGAFFVLIILIFAWYSKDLPTPGKIKRWRPAESTQIYDREGRLLFAVSGEQKRIVVSDKDIPDKVKQATISLEDRNFYKHHGVNFKSIARAVLYNLSHKDSIQGGSTITQQFVKNALLSPKRTFARKIKELILSIELEVMYSKEKILEFYLNEIPYGSNVYGVEAASKFYFDKSAKDLSLAEAATLASLPRAPTYYSPYGSRKDKLIARKNYALDSMADLGYITKDEAEKAKSEEIKFVPFKENILAPHFVMYVREQLAEKYGEQLVNEGGLKVWTTLDPEKQKIAEDVIYKNQDRIHKVGGSNAAMVSIDPKTGQILTMVGSFDYFDTQNDGNFNVAEAERQPGSSFKPVAYATAFKGKYNPAYTLFDLKTDFGGGYEPQNYDGKTRGPVTVRQALANSLNIPAVKILGLSGVANVLEQAHKMGITTLNDPQRYGLSLVLGGGEIKLVDLTTAYGVFANEGKLAPTTPFLKIEDNSGKVLEEFKEPKAKEVLDPQAAYQITSILSDDDARVPVFGRNNALDLGERPAAAKTGTTQEFRDAWTFGFTPSLVAGFWAGNNNNSSMKAGGANVAAPLWNEYMNRALEKIPIEDFRRPEGIQEISVDKFSNKLPTQYSPEVVKDIFTSWQVPTEKDDIHVVKKINKINGKLANDTTPPELIEERLYTNIHSEMPDSPNWEGPVISWARANGIENFPPREQDDMYSESSKKPQASIQSPQNGSSVSGNFEIKASASSPYGISKVEFFIDGTSIAEDGSSPYSIVYNANNLSASSHRIGAKAIDENDVSGPLSEISVTVTKDSSAPTFSGISASANNPTSATISWNTNESSTSQVIYGTSSGSYDSSSSLNGNLVTSHTLTISSLSPGTTYYYKVKSKDASGNESISSEYSFATPS